MDKERRARVAGESLGRSEGDVKVGEDIGSRLQHRRQNWQHCYYEHAPCRQKRRRTDDVPANPIRAYRAYYSRHEQSDCT